MPTASFRAESRAGSPPGDDLEEDEFVWDMVEELQAHGINAQDIAKLKKEGICTVSGVRMTSRRNLLKIKGMSEAKVDKIKEASQKILGSSFQTGIQVSDKRKRVLHISSGSKSVDNMLGGGFMSQSISEVYGEFRTGKTQLAHTLSVVAQLPPEMGGASGKVTYIDTEGTFRPDRIRAIADRFGVDPEQTLENITYARAYNSEHQAHGADSRSRYSVRGREELPASASWPYFARTTRGALAQMLAKLSKLAEEFNVVVLLTNQVQADPGATMAFAPTVKPIGGHILSHASATRIMLRKGRGEERVAKLVDSPDRPESEGSYKLDEGGWADV
ncbi:meiotic recombination protein DMC1, related protein [Ceratobasidium sp. AG-Ba]|nr:meiotic recombination protein DMC1, related protein [Ceratobasidium sp. AG-Ba]